MTKEPKCSNDEIAARGQRSEGGQEGWIGRSAGRCYINAVPPPCVPRAGQPLAQPSCPPRDGLAAASLWGQPRKLSGLLQSKLRLRRFLRCRARRRGTRRRREASCEIGRFCSSGRRDIRHGTRRCAHRRRASRRTGGRSWRRGRGRNRHQVPAKTTVTRTALCIKNSQDKGQNEKNPGQPAAEFRQHVGCLRTENILRNPPTKGCAKALTFRALH